MGRFSIHSGKDFITVLLLPNVDEKQSTMRIRVIDLSVNKNEALSVSEVKSVLLLNGNEL